ncbi:MAG: cobalt ECF transporter T component CbiQ, partial [Rikenellaceae bacterium]|nr:cobalt ECF transporter T component CbiQ [Rikenellaceae bacterium]
MSDRLQHLLVRLSSLDQAATRKPTIDLRARIIVTFVYLFVMLSVPIARLSELLLYALFPIICAAEVGIRYRPILRQSLVIVPFAALIGVFNIFYHREATFAVGGLIITRGWLEFGSIIVRAVLSVQTLPLLVQIEGYNPLCRSLQRLGVPAQLTTQLSM